VTGPATTTSTTESTDTGPAAGGCPVCPHPADAHDAIGTRFCAATAAGKFERGCVCPAGQSTGQRG